MSAKPTIFERGYQIRLKSPAAWALSARRLRQAARVLWDLHQKDLKGLIDGQRISTLAHLETAPVALMLEGLAVENLAKGALVRAKPPSESRSLPSELNHHKVGQLLKKAGVSLAPEEMALIERLERFVVWAGRYPVPKTVEGTATVPPGGRVRNMPSNLWFSSDVDNAERLCQKLESFLDFREGDEK